MLDQLPCTNIPWQSLIPALIRCDKTFSKEERAKHYWRDSIMLTGLAITISGIALSILQGAFLLSIALTFATCALAFGSYYVTRYADLKEMETQLSSLKGEVTTMRETNISLQATSNDLTTRLDVALRSLEETSQAFAKYRDAEPQLQVVVENLRLQEIALNQLKTQISITTRESLQLSENLAQDTNRLREVKAQLDATSNELKCITTELKKASREAVSLLRAQVTIQ